MRNDSQQPAIRRIAGKIASAVADANYAQRRVLELRLAPDHYVFRDGHAPDSYAEFLYRTSAQLPHEPSARERSGGRKPAC